MTREQAIKRATNRVLKDNSLVIVLDHSYFGEHPEDTYTTKKSDVCLPSSITVNEIVVHESNMSNYWVQEKLTIQNGRFKNTIIVVK